jgi:PEP-CTERM motif
MKNRAFRVVALVVGLMLMSAIPAQAGPVEVTDVVQVVSAGQRSGGQNASVALRFIAQDDNVTAGTTTGGTASSAGTTAGGDASLSGTVTILQDPTGGAIIQTEVTEEIGVDECECDYFTVPVAGFPKWPFIPLVGLVCLVPDLCTGEKCTPGPGEDENCQRIVCVTNCGEIPEPTSLLLFGSGIAALGASLRRRYAQAKEIKDQSATISGS